jgi:N-acetylglucosamine kinase-like BadF-type ATPase
MSLYLCVDCGGSKTSAVICSSSSVVIGRALSGPSNFSYLGVEAFTQAVGIAVSNALKTCTAPASIEPVPLPLSSSLFASAWFGISGVDSPSAITCATTALSELLNIPKGPRLVVANDTHLLASPLRLHSDINQAVVVIAGTGSIGVSFAKTPEGKLEELGRIGGWGWVLGDEGGGYHVGREAVRQLLIEHDRASVGNIAVSHSVLKQKILESFGVTSVLDILSIVHMPDPSPSGVQHSDIPNHLLVAKEKRLSLLSPLVFEAALSDGDSFALNVLKICSQALASQIQILLRSPNSNSEHAPKSILASSSAICFGGSLAGIERYRNMILTALEDEVMGGHVFKYVEYVDDPARVGAESLAAAVAGNS